MGITFLYKPRKDKNSTNLLFIAIRKLERVSVLLERIASKNKTNSKTVFVCLRACTCLLKHPRHFQDLSPSNGGLKTSVIWWWKGCDLVGEYRCIRRACSLH